MQDEEGQIVEAHSISAGLDYPGAGPEHAWLRDSGPRALRRRHRRRGARRVPRGRAPGGDHPGARDRARARTSRSHEPGGSTLDLVCLSGRGDKDLAEVLALGEDARAVSTGRRRGSRAPSRRRAAARAALMPYLMGGFPTLEASRARSARPTRDGGRRPARARRAVLRPARRRPGDPRRGHAALARRRDASTACSRSREALARGVPGRADVLREHRLRARRRALRASGSPTRARAG